MRTQLLAAALFAGQVHGQSLRGRVVREDSVTPIMGASVLLRDDSAGVVAHATTDREGRFTMVVSRNARRVRVTKLGYLPADIRIAAGDTSAALIVLNATAANLPTLRITDRALCGSARDRDRTLQVLESARVLLHGPHLTSAPSKLLLRILELRGAEDGPTRLDDGHIIWNAQVRNTEIDSGSATVVELRSVFGNTPQDTLSVRGYVRRNAHGTVFDVPNTETLLSDWFITGHCWEVRNGTREHPDWTGLAFRSSSQLDTIVDIDGVLWLDPELAELRLLEFAYTHLRRVAFTDCVSFKSTCMRRNLITNEGTGGSLTFAYLPSGEWFVNSWILRTPAEEFVTRYAGFGMRMARGRPERCSGGSDCLPVDVPVPRLVLTIGAVATVSVNGTEVYRDATVAGEISRLVDARTAKLPE